MANWCAHQFGEKNIFGAKMRFLEIVFLSVSALEVVVVGGGVDVALVAQELQSVVHVVAAHATSNLK